MDTYLINKLKKIINLNVIVIVTIILVLLLLIIILMVTREREQGEWDNPFQPEGEVSQDAEVSQTIRIS